MSNHSNRLTKEDFQLVGYKNANRFEQTISGQSKSYLSEVFRRFFKNKWACVFLFLFTLIIIMAIYVPITSPFVPFYPVVDSQFVTNLPPRPFNENAIITIRVSEAIKDYLQKLEIKNLIVSCEQNGIYWFVSLHPYYLPELKNLNLILGTDSYGSDIWTDLWSSVASSLSIAFIAATLAMIIGVIYGSIAGSNAGKWIDTIMMRFVEVILGTPMIIWVMILSIVFIKHSNDTSIINKQTDNFGLTLALVFTAWAQPAIATRTYILRVKNNEYISACQTFGGSRIRLIFCHMLPIIFGRILVIFVNLIPTIIFFEASLTFLNIKSASDASLGIMLNNAWKNISQLNLMLPPIIVFSLFTISAQIIANSLNDAIDPRIMGR